jgi:hypothetical protein
MHCHKVLSSLSRCSWCQDLTDTTNWHGIFVSLCVYLRVREKVDPEGQLTVGSIPISNVQVVLNTIHQSQSYDQFHWVPSNIGPMQIW